MKRFSFVVAAVIISSAIPAQENDTTARSLDEIVVSASKYPKKQSETGKVITVINATQIARSGGQTMSELLNTIPGVTIIGANNNMGTNLNSSIRGSSAGNILILLDGVPVYDPSVITNYFDLNFIDLSQVERIEIMKGGHSTLYGSDAVAGVINIIRKKPGIAKLNVNAGLAGGSYHTFRQSLGLGGMIKKLDYSINYSHIGSKGFSSATDGDNTGIFDDDGYDQHNVNARVGFSPMDKLKIILTGSLSRYETDLDASGFIDDRDYTATNKNDQLGAGIVYTAAKGNIHLNYNFNRSDRKYLDDSIHKSSTFYDYSRSLFTGRTHFAEIYSSWKWTRWELLSGLDYRKNDTEQEYWSTGVFGPYAPPVLIAEMSQWSPYASVVFKPNKAFTAEAGGRWNYHSEYGNNFSFTLNPSLLLDKMKVFANIYTAFKTPTLYQLFDQVAGNAGLQPEKSLIFEGGLQMFSSKNFTSRVVAFYRTTDDAIIYYSNPVTFESRYLNAARQKNHGLELEANYTGDKFNLRAGYAYTNGSTTTSYDGTGAPLGKDTTYFNLYRIPKHAFNVNAGVQLTGKIYAGSRLQAISNREEFIYGAAPSTLKGYVLADLFGEYKISRRFMMFADLKNIFNKRYVDFQGFNTRRFNFMAGLNFKI